MTASLYLVLCGQHVDEYAPERSVTDMDSAGTLRDIADGQFENLTRVIDVDTGADVTGMFVKATMNIWASQGEPLTRFQRDFIEMHVGVQAANAFKREAA
jgi:hypothetical protein